MTDDDPGASARNLDLMLPRAIALRAGREPDRLFLQEVTGRSATYREFEESVHRWAGGLVALGAKPGQRIGSFLPQSIDAHALWLANARIGVLHVPVNPELRGDLLRHVIGDAGIELAFARPEQAPALRAAGLPTGVRLVAVPDGTRPLHAIEHSNAISWPDVLDAVTDPPDPLQPAPTDVSSVIYTSGTTGAPKGVLVTWAQISNTLGLHRRGVVADDDAYYVPWPPFHVMGLTPLAMMAAAGGRVALRDRVSVSAFWEDVMAYRCGFATIGPIARLLLDRAPGPQDERNPLKVIVGVSGPDREEFMRRFDVESIQVYGSTEAAYPIVNRDKNAQSYQFSGRLRPGYSARLVDETLGDVPEGSPGELLIRAPSPALLSPGYLGRPDLTEKSRRGEWYRTRDVFVRHPNGMLEFVDRMGDSIRRFGENIPSGFIETAVLQLPGVLECAAVAAPSRISGEEVHLAIVPTAHGIDAEALIGRLARVLPAFMLPSIVSIWDSLPKTPNGKIRKAAIRAAGVPDGAWRSPGAARHPVAKETSG